MNSDAAYYHESNALQMRDARTLLAYIQQMDWSEADQDVVMDIGCGPGSTLLKVFLPAFPRAKNVVAIDILPTMIEFARKNNSNQRIDYQVVDFSDRSLLTRWEKQITKAVSVYCIQWFKNQRSAFENIFYVLKPGGEAALMIPMSSSFYDAIQNIMTSAKWEKYLKNADPSIPDSHFCRGNLDYYRKILLETGFEILKIDLKDMVYLFDEDGYADFLCVSNGLSKYIPKDEISEWRKDFYRANLDLSTYAPDGGIQLHYQTLYLLLRKPEPEII